jgi:L-glutamine-phosphate cytidylyltransferase
MKVIVLDAGTGSRLLPFTKKSPKCLLDIGNGMSALEYQMMSFALCGIEEVVIVGGYRIDQLRAAVEEYTLPELPVTVLYHPHYKQYNNLFSLWMARDHLTGDVVVLNGDTLFDWRILWSLEAPRDERVTLTIDRKGYYDQDDMKVRLNGRHVAAVTKQIHREDADAESIGMIRFQNGGAALMREALRRRLNTENGVHQFYLQAIQDIVDIGEEVGVHDVAGKMWRELDFPSDLTNLRKDIHKFPPVHRHMLTGDGTQYDAPAHRRVG